MRVDRIQTSFISYFDLSASNIYNYISKPFKLPSNQDRIHYRKHYSEAQQLFSTILSSRHNSFLPESASNFLAQLQSPPPPILLSSLVSPGFAPFCRCFFPPLFPDVHAVAKQSRRFSVCRFPRMKRQSQDKVAEYGVQGSRGCVTRATLSLPPSEANERVES